jgi:hypothetical protein
MATEKGSIVQDGELRAMSNIAKILDRLEPNVRKRVLAWLYERERERTESKPTVPS